MNSIREIEKINQQELDRGIAGTSASWHSQYANSAWCYVGNLDHQLTEGDVLCIMSQYGEVDDIHLVREEDTGKSRGFGFIKYEDARSCVLAVDNFCGTTILGRSLRVDHVENYRLPKKLQEKENESGGQPAAGNGGSGHAYEGMEFENKYNIHQGMDLFAAPPSKSNGDDESKSRDIRRMEKMKRKEERQRKREEKDERRRKREERRERHEEKRRKKRARKYDESHGED